MKILKIFFQILLLVIVFSSCTTNKQLVYLQDEDKDNPKTEFERPDDKPYRLKSQDVLYIKIVTVNQEINELFNLQNGNNSQNINNMNSNGMGMYLTGYTLDNEGFIELPILGKVNVQNKTVIESKQIIQAEAEKFLKDPEVVVKLVSFNISFIGEIVATQTIYRERINIFEAIAMAGEISNYGDRKNVQIIRHVDNKIKIHKVDLTKKDILESDLYYLKPNDIVYVKPLKSKSFRTAISEYSMVLGTITSTLSFVLLIMNLL